ncbi:MAG TPA: DUF4325 domain-containing protein [Jatrophihabitans sp.]
MADAGAIPSTKSAGGHRLFDADQVRAALGVHTAVISAATVEPTEEPSWSVHLGLEDLEEDVVWRQLESAVGIDTAAPAGKIAQFSFLEMLNNAIDHSGGDTVEVAFWSTESFLALRIADDGEGALAHLRRILGLSDDFEAIVALTKGKQTTMRDRHTGEGIFFTSKANDLFQLAANGKRWTVDNLRADQSVGISSVQRGTVVFARIATDTKRTLQSVFRAFTKDHEFVRTRPSVKLAGLGLQFVSRSEARRLLNGLDDFTEIDLDFAGVADVGQAFIDEAFRVWPSQHPGKTLRPINMNEAVDFMVQRGLSDKRPQ